jgi:ribose transport system permease protein
VPRSPEATSADPLSQESAAAVAAPSGRTVSGVVSAVFHRHSILLLVVLLVVVFSILAPETFPTVSNLQGLALQNSVSTMLALAVLMVVVVGEFDLSVGYSLGFSAVLAAKLTADVGVPVPVTVVVTLAVGTVVGLACGVLVTRFKVVSLIATLGVGLAVSGLTVGLSGGQTISQNLPAFFSDLVQTRILGLAAAVWLVVLVALVPYVVLTKTPAGSKVYAAGGSERVAEMVGIRVPLLKTAMFSLAGTTAGLAGIMQLGLAGAANPSFGANLLLPAFAAVFLGSTTVRPGFFNVGGTLLAVVLLAVGFSGLSLLGAPFWLQPVFNGVALVVGVILSKWMSQSFARGAATGPRRR